MKSRYYRPAAIDLLNINKGPNRWNKDQSKGSKLNKSNITCYRYSKQGHFACNCYIKNKVVQQLNMLTTSNNRTSKEQEVLTNNIGCLIEDKESKYSTA